MLKDEDLKIFVNMVQEDFKEVSKHITSLFDMLQAQHSAHQVLSNHLLELEKRIKALELPDSKQVNERPKNLEL